MRTALIFTIVFASALLAGAILAYPAFLAINCFHEMAFHKVISRTTVLSGLIFSLFYLRFYGLLNRENLGFHTLNDNGRRLFFRGFAAGMIILILLDGILLLLDIYSFDERLVITPGSFLLVVIKAMITGLLVGLIEETIFRGALFGGLRKQSNAAIAVFVTSFVYAAVHFLKYRAVPENMDIGWFTGIEIFPAALFRFSNPVTIDSFITLFILGCLFAMVRLRSQSLIACIGLHAGIVATLKVFNYLTNFSGGTSFDYLVNKYDHQFGYLASSLLLLAILIYHVLSGKQQTAVR